MLWLFVVNHEEPCLETRTTTSISTQSLTWIDIDMVDIGRICECDDHALILVRLIRECGVSTAEASAQHKQKQKGKSVTEFIEYLREIDEIHRFLFEKNTL